MKLLLKTIPIVFCLLFSFACSKEELKSTDLKNTVWIQANLDSPWWFVLEFKNAEEYIFKKTTRDLVTIEYIGIGKYSIKNNRVYIDAKYHGGTTYFFDIDWNKYEMYVQGSNTPFIKQ